VQSLIKPIKFLKPFDASKISINEYSNFSDVYVVELPLDSTPDKNWRDIFEQKWRSSRDLWDRKIYLINDKIKLLSTVDYFDEKLDWMERIIDDTNKAVEEYNRLVEEESELIKGETAKQLLRMESDKARIIMNAITKKLA
jgi:hypothetical protein